MKKIKKPYQLRLDEQMIEVVKKRALENDRSANSEFRNLIAKALKIDTTIKNEKL